MWVGSRAIWLVVVVCAVLGRTVATVHTLTPLNFEKLVKGADTFLVLFMNVDKASKEPVEEESKLLLPEFNAASQSLSTADSRYQFGVVDCAEYAPVCKFFSIKSFPSLFLFHDGMPVIRNNYFSGRTKDAIVNYLTTFAFEGNVMKPVESPPPEPTKQTTVNVAEQMRDAIMQQMMSPAPSSSSSSLSFSTVSASTAANQQQHQKVMKQMEEQRRLAEEQKREAEERARWTAEQRRKARNKERKERNALLRLVAEMDEEGKARIEEKPKLRTAMEQFKTKNAKTKAMQMEEATKGEESGAGGGGRSGRRHVDGRRGTNEDQSTTTATTTKKTLSEAELEVLRKMKKEGQRAAMRAEFEQTVKPKLPSRGPVKVIDKKPPTQQRNNINNDTRGNKKQAIAITTAQQSEPMGFGGGEARHLF